MKKTNKNTKVGASRKYGKALLCEPIDNTPLLRHEKYFLTPIKVCTKGGAGRIRCSPWFSNHLRLWIRGFSLCKQFLKKRPLPLDDGFNRTSLDHYGLEGILINLDEFTGAVTETHRKQ